MRTNASSLEKSAVKTWSCANGGFAAPDLFKLDLVSGDVTQLTSIPEPMLNDIFCGDRSGHIYAAGDSNGTSLWRYDIATDTWSVMPSLPGDHGNNGACSVHADGWLFVTVPETSGLYRLKLNFAE